MLDKNLCILPWISLYIRADGNIYPCESVAWQGDDYLLGNLNTTTLEEAWNHDMMKKLRLKVITNSTCELSNEEKNSCMYLINHSLYEDVYKNYKNETKSDGSYKVDIKALFLERSNLCNLQCLYCCDVSSSSWERKNKTNIMKISDTVYDLKVLPITNNLRELFLSGGEPVINKYNKKLLQHLINHNPNIELGMATNLTYNFELYEEFFSLLEKFNNTKVFCSVDSSETRHDFIRINSNWNTVKTNLNKLKNYKVRIYFNSVISLLSAFYLKEFHETLINMKIIGIDGIRYINLTGPEELCIQSLSFNKKKELKEYLISYINFLKENENLSNNIDLYPNNNKPSQAADNIIKFLFKKLGNNNYIDNLSKFVSIDTIKKHFDRLL